MKEDWEAAIRRGDLPQVRSLIEQGVDVNAKDSHGQTTLMRASLSGQSELVRALVAQGADLNATTKYKLSALMLAVINGHTEVVQSLAAAGADLGIRGGKSAAGFYGKTALDLAQYGQKTPTIELLRDGGAAE